MDPLLYQNVNFNDTEKVNFTSGKKVQPFKILHVEIMFLFNQLSYYEPTVHSNSILYMTLMFLSGCG